MTYRHFIQPDSAGWTTRDWREWAVEQNLLLDVRADAGDGVCDGCWGGTPKTYERGVLVETDSGFVTPAVELTRWPRCFLCSNFDGIAGILPISYSVESGLESAIWRAKNEDHYRWLNIALASVLHEFLTRHLSCIERRWGRIDIITPVPSHSSTRGGWDHMQDLLDRVRSWPGSERWVPGLLDKTDISTAGTRRGAPTAGLFRLAEGGPPVARRRVLLIDDTYTSGATVRSAGHALISEGALSPVVVTIGRQVRRDAYGAHIVEDAVSRHPRFDVQACAVEHDLFDPFPW